MIPDTAFRPSMSVAQAVLPDDDASAERWRQWQARNAVTSRTDARRVRVAFTILFAGLSAWLGLQLLAPALWP